LIGIGSSPGAAAQSGETSAAIDQRIEAARLLA
jgi:hypothetical protein